MYRILLTLILLFSYPLFSSAQTTNPDMTVFGYKIGEKLTIPECPCKIVETKTVGSSGVFSIKHFKGYQYAAGLLDPVASTCFERPNIESYNVKKSEQLNPLPAYTDGFIHVRFAPGDAPAKQMCPLAAFDGKIENSKLALVTFTIYTGDADAIVGELKKKYGTNAVVKNYSVQNGYGATLNYYIAIWGFPNLEVALQSSMHRSLSEQFGNVIIAIPQKTSEPEAKRKL